MNKDNNWQGLAAGLTAYFLWGIPSLLLEMAVRLPTRSHSRIPHRTRGGILDCTWAGEEAPLR